MIQIKKYGLLLLIAFTALQITACSSNENTPLQNKSSRSDTAAEEVSDNTVTLTPQQLQSLDIKTGKAGLRNLSAVIQVNGRLEVPPQNAVSITIPYGGIVKSTTLLDGKRVTKGERLVTLESPEFIQLQQDYLDGTNQLEFLTSEYNRQQELATQNINAKKTLQKSKADYQAALNKVKGLKAKLSLIHINTNTLEENGIQNTVTIYSPINGYVTQVNVNRGTHVNPNDMMFRIVNSDNMYVELAVFEKDIPRLKRDLNIHFSLVNDSTAYRAQIYLIGKEIGKDGSIPVNCRITSPITSSMIPGIYLKATIETGTSQLTALPENAIVSFGGKDYVFQPESPKSGSIQDGYSFRMLEVETGVTENGYTAVTFTKDFNPNMAIVIEGAYDLLSKMKNTSEEE
ncbi:efflux RND transporter periplasmic adaptor subunit [Arachidicoccus ginsenosidivorans]|jgi:cobalt-zinc-cadmium efflux system membrane fusion protein|uniref:Membrane fusion protein, cobalt-zinc-cadmium efflux system n=2 Tax=Arachidicoccus TaxID=1769012 RepID=A0A1H4CR48_9BACT|nr:MULTISPECIES: efflux RND transporter periplasmic adaptor subunit [Arachidicoccus]QEC73288.1 efflux RND transporter periplasmic adaptor subunit [Arachidicoccus ginsenosidivorans]SEA62854.1 membrane fusion protein, cobalt-zinc-cadmium efflux system [Arachidicoccus rhizosphaerae]